MVGTSPTESPSARQEATALRNAATVLTTPKSGIGHLSDRRVTTVGAKLAAGRPDGQCCRLIGLASAAMAIALLAVSPAIADAQGVQPEIATGAAARAQVMATREMAVAANPHAARAGAEILAAGGSAVDAAIAMQLVLNLVEPQSSGIGGGAFLLHYDAGNDLVTSHDGRETAPAAATAERFLNPDGSAPGYFEALVGGRSVGTPGLLRMLEDVHDRFGTLPWAELFEPAIALADEGFEISPRLAKLAGWAPTLRRLPVAAAYFLDADGKAKPAGTLLQNPDYAFGLRAIAEGGANAFYRGLLAGEMVAAVTGAAINPGDLTRGDLARYKAMERPPVCLTYREHRICGMGPPSSGGITVLQIMAFLSAHDMAALAPGSEQATHLIAEAGRLAYADRDRYIADPDFVDVPAGLLDEAYLRHRAALIDAARAGEGKAGLPPGARQGWLDAPSPELPATSHLSVVDAEGNAVAMTTSIEFAFGSAVMVRGFLLNNQLTDFSFAPERDGELVANRVEPGKRPRSSMAPTLVFDADGKLKLVLGSPGGSRIICYVAKTLVAVIDWRMDVQAAVDSPNICNRNGKTDIERGTPLEGLAEGLAARGHEVAIRDMNSGLHAIHLIRDGDGTVQMQGAADRRREGIAAGQ